MHVTIVVSVTVTVFADLKLLTVAPFVCSVNSILTLSAYLMHLLQGADCT